MGETEDKAEVRSVIEKMTEALNAGDAATFAAFLSDREGSIHIGTDASEWWTKAQLTADLPETQSAGGNTVRAVHDEVEVHVLGDVAWSESRARFLGPDGAQRDVRVTGVLVRENGHWKAAQTHASIGVPNEEIFSS